MDNLKNNNPERIGIEDFLKSKKNPIILVLDNVRSMHNVGSIFRSADAFAIDKIYLCGITPKPPHREIHKTALGATESIEWEYFDSSLKIINDLKSQGYKIIAIEQVKNGTFLENYSVNKNEKYALVFGNEVDGITQDILSISDSVIEISQFGIKHSLNVSVCAGILMWYFSSELKKTSPTNK